MPEVWERGVTHGIIYGIFYKETTLMAKKLLYFKEGEKIISAGARENRMYVILDGTVAIRLVEGHNEIIVTELQKNDFFGEMSLFCNNPRSADAIATSDVQLAYIESIQQLNTFLSNNQNFALKMVRILAERLAKTNELLIGKVSEINRLKVTSEVDENKFSFLDMV